MPAKACLPLALFPPVSSHTINLPHMELKGEYDRSLRSPNTEVNTVLINDKAPALLNHFVLKPGQRPEDSGESRATDPPGSVNGNKRLIVCEPIKTHKYNACKQTVEWRFFCRLVSCTLIVLC